MKKALIIGTGLGGLSTALRLATKGYQVEMVEKYHQPGGRLNQLSKDGFTFDMGPSFFSMSYEFDELFRSCGLPNPLKYVPLDPLYTVNFAGSGKSYNIYKDAVKLAKEFASIEPDFENKRQAYLEKAKAIFHDTEYRIVKKNFNSKLHYLQTLTTVPLKHGPMLFRSMWDELGRYFTSEEVKIIFSLVSFFLGATPFNTPAVYSLLNYTELEHDGYWNVEGGMYRITEEMVKLLQVLNVKIHYNTEIVGVASTGKQIDHFIDGHGKKWDADVYVVNSDAAAFRGKILNRNSFEPAKLDKMHWTLAPYTMYLGVDRKLPQLNHHNYFLGNNFNDYATKIFRSTISPEKPYYYVNVSSYSNPDCAPEGCENLFILCPVPDLRFKGQWDDADRLGDTIIDDLSARIGVPLKEHIVSRTIMTPADWEGNFNLYRGSGLGLAHGMMQVGGMRPSNKDEDLKDLYYVGASTVPGTGLPIVIISSKLVSERIFKEHDPAFSPDYVRL